MAAPGRDGPQVVLPRQHQPVLGPDDRARPVETRLHQDSVDRRPLLRAHRQVERCPREQVAGDPLRKRPRELRERRAQVVVGDRTALPARVLRLAIGDVPRRVGPGDLASLVAHQTRPGFRRCGVSTEQPVGPDLPELAWLGPPLLLELLGPVELGLRPLLEVGSIRLLLQFAEQLVQLVLGEAGRLQQRRVERVEQAGEDLVVPGGELGGAVSAIAKALRSMPDSDERTTAMVFLPKARAACSVPLPATTTPSSPTTIGLCWPKRPRLPWMAAGLRAGASWRRLRLRGPGPAGWAGDRRAGGRAPRPSRMGRRGDFRNGHVTLRSSGAAR